MSRTIVLIPKYVMNKIGYCNCPDFILELAITQQSIPSMTIVEKENFFTVRMNRCCPCDCPDKISFYKVRKENIDEFLEKQLEECVKVFDE
jgi:hypothetical protein